jgi:hypothetical protein
MRAGMLEGGGGVGSEVGLSSKVGMTQWGEARMADLTNGAHRSVSNNLYLAFE